MTRAQTAVRAWEGALGRVSKLFKGFANLFVRKLERENPKALLEAEMAAFHEATGRFNETLTKQASLVERIRQQVAREEQQIDELTARAAAKYKAGSTAEAGRLALEIKERRREVEENKSQVLAAEDLYANLTRQRDTYVREARKRFEHIKQKMNRAEVAEAQADLAEIASASSLDSAGTGATLERIEEDLDERIFAAQGKARVANDLIGGGEWALLEQEQKALEQQALDELAATLGLAGQGAAAPAAARELEVEEEAESVDKTLG